MKMHPGAVALIAVFVLVGCKDKDTEAVPVSDDSAEPYVESDSGETTADDTGDTPPEPCEVALVETEPLYGNTSWYYRDALDITFDDDASKLAAITVTDGAGADVGLSISWDDSGFNATVTADSGAWGGSTDYILLIDICDASSEIAYSTTAYGEELSEDTSMLIGNAYYIDMSRATYTEPAGVGAIMSLYLSEPLLLGVMDATDSTLTLMGSQGYIHETSGDVLQDTDYASWDFGTADFTSSPFFVASGETVFEYNSYEIPVYSFTIDGTFSADGTTIGGASFRGLGDTRNMGPLLQLGNDPGATCELLSKYGLSCEACPDEELYCLTIAGDFEDAELLEGTTLEYVAPE
jgi:hypothetical protein